MATKETARESTVPEDVTVGPSPAPAGAPPGPPEPGTTAGLASSDELETLLAEELSEDAFDLTPAAASPSNDRLPRATESPGPTRAAGPEALSARPPVQGAPATGAPAVAVVPEDIFEADDLFDAPIAAPDLGTPWEAGEVAVAGTAAAPLVTSEVVEPPDLGSPWESAELSRPAEPLPPAITEVVELARILEQVAPPAAPEEAISDEAVAEAEPPPPAVEARAEEEFVAAPELGLPWESAELPRPVEPLPPAITEVVELARILEQVAPPGAPEEAISDEAVAEAEPPPAAVEARAEEELVAAPELGSPWESAELSRPAEPLPPAITEVVELARILGEVAPPEAPEEAISDEAVAEAEPPPGAVEARAEEEIVAAPELGSPWESAELTRPAEPLPTAITEVVELARILEQVAPPAAPEEAVSDEAVAEAEPPPPAVETPAEEAIVAAPELGSLWESAELPRPAEPLPPAITEVVELARILGELAPPAAPEEAISDEAVAEAEPPPAAVEARAEEELVAAPELGSPSESAELLRSAEPLPPAITEVVELARILEQVAPPAAPEEAISDEAVGESEPPPPAVEAPAEEQFVAPPAIRAEEAHPVPFADESPVPEPVPQIAPIPAFDDAPVAPRDRAETESLEEELASAPDQVLSGAVAGPTTDLESASLPHETQAPKLVAWAGEESPLPAEPMVAHAPPALRLALPDEPISEEPVDAGLLPEMDELEALEEIPKEIPRFERKREVVRRKLQIGEMLLESGAIGQDQLEMALAEQRRTKNLLGEVLVNLGFASEDLVAQAVADQTGIPLGVVPKDPLPPELRKLIPEDIARKHRLLPLAVEGNELRLAMANPFDVVALDLIRATTGLIPLPSIAPWGRILEAIERNFVQRESFDETFERLIVAAEARVGKDIDEDVTHGPLVELVDQLIVRAVEERATDIHIEPEEVVVRIRYRIDSILQPGPMIPKKLQTAIAARIKVMSGLNIAESRVPQDGRIRFGIKGRQIDLRVSTFLCNYGENIVLRVLDKASVVLSLDKLGFLADDLETFNRLIEKPHGIIFVTGPTGSGKTTTLYAALAKLNTIDVNIMTIEDPIEYEINLIRQSQVNEKAGITFAGGLRAIMRQDPDVVLIGETRDEETASMATRAAMTGHLVFTTLHTNTAAGAVSRIVDLDVEPLLVADTVIASIGQRLIRLVCPKCKTLVPAPPERRAELEAAAEREHMDWDGLVPEPKGCPSCRFRGYHGRSGLFEIFEMTREAQDLVLHHHYGAELTRLARAQGMRTMYEDGLRRIILKSCTLDEVDRVIESDKRAEASAG